MRSLAQNPPQKTPATRDRAHIGQGLAATPIHQLQRTIGNQAVQRMLRTYSRTAKADAAANESAGSDPDFNQIPVRGDAPVGIQPKLTVNTPGDIYEQEADRVADAVMRAPDLGIPRLAPNESDPEPVPSAVEGPGMEVSEKSVADEEDFLLENVVAEKCDCDEDHAPVADKPEIQRSESRDAGEAKVEPEIETRIEAMRGGGRPLTLSERQFMEPRFGADFSPIRIHTNQEADACSRAVQARAFTLGSDLFFRAGEYAPGSTESHRLLAHELTHAIQQGAAKSGSLGGPHTAARAAAFSSVQRQPDAGAPAPVPAPAPVVVPAGRATVNFLPVVHDRVPAGWGITAPDRTVLDITAYANGATWNCVITTADQQTHQGVRLLAGVVELTAALVAASADCAVLKTMSTSLTSVADQGAHSGFYMLSAVQAHENVHVTEWRTGLAPHYATLKAAVEALSVPSAAHADAAAAKAAIQALPAFTAARAAFRAGETAVASATAAHTSMAPFIAAEHAVVDPMIATIGARRTALACAP